jgi:hypothetical protein
LQKCELAESEVVKRYLAQVNGVVEQQAALTTGPNGDVEDDFS